MRENVVEIKRQPLKPREPRTGDRLADMRGNNRFHDLLETYAESTSVLYDAKRAKAKAYYEIMEMIGGAEEILADRFHVWVTLSERPEKIVPEHVVPEKVIPARTIKYLRVRRRGR